MTTGRNPAAFGVRSTLALIVTGFIAFIVLLAWMGTGAPPGTDGGAHGLGKGIIGYAGLAAMLDADGRKVGFNRVPGHTGGTELLILTPLAYADAKEIAAQVHPRRAGLGPTIVVTPKWFATPLQSDPRTPADPRKKAWASVFGAPRAPAGWSTIVGAGTPVWSGFLDHIGVALGNARTPLAHGWHTFDGTHGPLPDDRVVLSGGGSDDDGHPLIPLIRAGDGRILAGYFADGGAYPALDAMAAVASTGDDVTRQPLIMVFEPDVLNNRGLADRATGLLAQRLITAAAGNDQRPVVFDLSLAGLGSPRNLFTLAFTPPFLAATICLIMTMAGSIWRGFIRFGPAQLGAPGAAAGKIALITGGAALVLRAGRYRLLAAPYADAARERLQHALGLPRARPEAETDAAIARIQHAAAPDTMPFGEAVERLRTARTPAAITARAAALHRIEQALGHARFKERP